MIRTRRAAERKVCSGFPKRSCANKKYQAYVPRSTRLTCDVYQFAYQRSTHGIGMIRMLSRLHTMVRQSTSSPDPVKTTSRCVPAMLLQIHRNQAVVTQAQPMIVMTESISNTLQPK